MGEVVSKKEIEMKERNEKKLIEVKKVIIIGLDYKSSAEKLNTSSSLSSFAGGYSSLLGVE